MSASLVTVVVIVTGALIGGGLFAVGTGLRPRIPSLSAVFDRMDGPDLAALAVDGPANPERGGGRLGAWLTRHAPIPVNRRARRMLALRGSSVAEFHADKCVWAVIGALVPSVAAVGAQILFGIPAPAPVAAGLIGAGAGFFVPDVLLRRDTRRFRGDAAEAVFTYFDLVTLERLANLSAIQAMYSAAALAANPVFAGIDAALSRARLQQQPPYAELRRLADELELPQLADLADVMQLEETGASLSGALRARVRELRDAHLAEAKIAAHDRSEQMTVFMTIPAMIFGLIFLLPPLLRLLGG